MSASDRDSKDGVHMSRLLSALCIPAIVLIGCAAPSSTTMYPMPGSGVAPVPLAQQMPARAPALPSSAEALSQTTSAYAQSIENQLDKRAVKPQGADTAAKAPERIFSSVQWLQPTDFRLHIAPPQSQEGPDKLENRTTTANQPQNMVSIGPRPDASAPPADISRASPPSFRENPAT